MTLNGSNGHFTLNFHLRTDFESYYLLIYCRVCLRTHVTRGDVRKRRSGPYMFIATIIGEIKMYINRRNAEYLESAEKLRIFRRRYIVGTLTNKDNISI